MNDDKETCSGTFGYLHHGEVTRPRVDILLVSDSFEIDTRGCASPSFHSLTIFFSSCCSGAAVTAEELHELWVEELSFVIEGVVLTSTSALGCALNFMGFYVMITGKMKKAFSNQGSMMMMASDPELNDLNMLHLASHN